MFLTVLVSAFTIGSEFSNAFMARRIRKEKSFDGLSPTQFVILGTCIPVWIAIPILGKSLVLLVAWICWAVLLLWVIWEMWKYLGEVEKGRLIRIFAVVGIIEIMAVIWLPQWISWNLTLGIIANGFYFFTVVPQVWVGLRSETTRGVSLLGMSGYTLNGVTNLAIGLGLDLGIAPEGEIIWGAVFSGSIILLADGSIRADGKPSGGWQALGASRIWEIARARGRPRLEIAMPPC